MKPIDVTCAIEVPRSDIERLLREGARERVPLYNTFPRYHQFCDRCDKPIGAFGCMRGERETPAGSFKYSLCGECCSGLEGKRKSVRENAIKHAMVRHAARYSEAFGRFVAEWYGVRVARSRARRVQA